MTLFDEYKHLIDVINETMNDYLKIGAYVYYDTFLNVSLEEMRMKLNEVSINLISEGRIKFSKKKKEFEKIRLETQVELIETLKKILSNKVWGTANDFKDNIKIVHKNTIIQFENAVGETWGKIEKEVGEEINCIYLYHMSLTWASEKIIKQMIEDDKWDYNLIDEIMKLTKEYMDLLNAIDKGYFDFLDWETIIENVSENIKIKIGGIKKWVNQK